MRKKNREVIHLRLLERAEQAEIRARKKAARAFKKELPPDKRCALFARYQQFRRYMLTRGAEMQSNMRTCACGAAKLLSATYCPECKDAKLLIQSRIPPEPYATAAAQKAVREREPVQARVYPMPDAQINRKIHIEEMSPGQENALRILEDG